MFDVFKNRDLAFKKNLTYFLIAYFLVLFNYSMVRAASTTLFFEAFGAKSTPIALFWSVFVLSLSIFCCNYFQKTATVQRVFFGASVFTALLFSASTLGVWSGAKPWAYGIFIWKEIYIVLQVHLLLAFANVSFSRDDFKRLVGPIGAAGSIGGALGGVATSYLSSRYGTFPVMWIGLIFVLLPAIFFSLTPSLLKKQEESQISPLGSLQDPHIKRYVFCIAMIVAVTQFMINILDFKFNLAFEAAVPDSAARTGYLGSIYTWTNVMTFFLQVIVLPFLLPKVSEKNYHLFIPASYIVSIVIMILAGESGGTAVVLFSVASVYVYVKAADYSLFSAGKEILYQPLKNDQKYGAKYLTDMLVYRGSKALVAVVLIYLQSSFILNGVMILLLLVWSGMVFRLFSLQKSLT